MGDSMRKTAKERKQLKQEKNTFSSSNNEVFNFLKILIVVVVLVIVFWLITMLITNDKTKKSEDTVIQYNEILVGSILSKDSEKYYVLVEAENDDNVYSYEQLITKYKNKEDHLDFYTVDLSDDFNSKFVSDKANLNVKKITDIRFSETTLLEIKNKKIVKTITSDDEIEKYLTNLSA